MLTPEILEAKADQAARQLVAVLPPTVTVVVLLVESAIDPEMPARTHWADGTAV